MHRDFDSSSIVFHLLAKPGEISDKHKAELTALAKSYNHQFIFHEFEAEAFNLTIDHITQETYFRYWAPQFIQSDKALYMDGDILVNKDITQLFNLDLKDNYIGGVFDSYVHEYDQSYGYFEKIGHPDLRHHYVNAGVLLMNLKKMREDNLTQKLIEYSREHCADLEFQDQDVLNIVCKGSIQLLDSGYNCALNDMRKIFRLKRFFYSPAICHWTGSSKPWNNRHLPYANLYRRMTKLMKHKGF